ncbi:MAG: hypothetical protein U1E65_07700 [Myxococcota bacterium]
MDAERLRFTGALGLVGGLLLISCSKAPLRVELSIPAGATAAIVIRSPTAGGTTPWSAEALLAGDSLDEALALASYDGTGMTISLAAFDTELTKLPFVPGSLQLADAMPNFSLAELRPRWTLRADVSGAVPGPIMASASELPADVVAARFKGRCSTTTISPNAFVNFEEYGPIGCDVPFPSRAGLCFGELREIADVRSGTITLDLTAHAPTVTLEGGQRVMYVSATEARWDSLERHFRVPLASPTEASGDAVDIDELPRLFHGPGPEWESAGWASYAFLRGDGLELLYSTSYPDRGWQDEELYLSSRASLSAPWSKGVIIDNLTLPAAGTPWLEGQPCPNVSRCDGASTPLLLADHKTMIYVGGATLDGVNSRPTLHWARRKSTEAGDLGFESYQTLNTKNNEICFDCGLPRLSCDGRHLIFIRNGQAWITRLSVLPVNAEAPRLVAEDFHTPYPLPALPPGEAASDVAEAPDCSGLYVTVGSRSKRPLYADRVACP